jgi:hypothetical protein
MDEFFFFFILFALPKKYAKTLDNKKLPTRIPKAFGIEARPSRKHSGLLSGQRSPTFDIFSKFWLLLMSFIT